MADETTVDPTHYRALFADGEPIRVKDLAAAAAVPLEPEPAPTNNNKATPFNREQWIFGVAAMKGTKMISQALQQLIEDCKTDNRGRKRTCAALDAILFACSTYLYGGAQGVHLKNRPNQVCGSSPRLVDQINDSLQESRPDEPDWRLAQAGFTRDHHRHLREDYLCDAVMDELERVTRDFMVQAATRIGLFDPRAGTYTDPSTTQIVVADGVKIGGLYNNGDPDKINKRTGKPKRCDTEAFTPKSKSGDSTPPPPHYEWVILVARTTHPRERIPLAISIKGEEQRGTSDATLAVDTLTLLSSEHPDLIRGLFGFGYDGALSADDKERLLKMGVQPISKMRRTDITKPVMHNLGSYDFSIETETAKGKPKKTVVFTGDVITVDGTATVIVTDGNGDDTHVPLTCVQRRRKKQRTGGYSVTNTYALPDHPIMPEKLHGATTRIRMDTAADELDKDNPVLMPHRVSSFPVADPRHKNLYNVRQDCESGNRHLREFLRDKRCITATRNNNRYQAIGYQLLVTASALIAYSERTGDYLEDFFGQRLVPGEDRQSDPSQSVVTDVASSVNGYDHQAPNGSRSERSPLDPMSPLAALRAASMPSHMRSHRSNGTHPTIPLTISRSIPRSIAP